MAQTLQSPSPTRSRPVLAARAILASGGFFVALAGNASAQQTPAPAASRTPVADAAVSLNALRAEQITEDLIDRLEAWARLSGYLHLFHPSEWAWTTDMFGVARDGFDAAAKATDPVSLADALRRLSSPVGPAVQVWPTEGETPARPDMTRGAHRDGVAAVIGWRHDGYTPTMQMRGPMFSRRIGVAATGREAINYGFAPDNPYERALPGGVRVRVPHALWMDKHGGILPDPIPRTRIRRDWPNTWTYRDASERLAAVAFAWNLVQHFHPTLDRAASGWDDALREGLRGALLSRGRADTLLVVQRMFASVGDSQAEAWDPEIPSPYLPMLDVGIVEGELTVTRVESVVRDNLNIQPGDRIVRIDGEPSEAVLARWMARLGGPRPEAAGARAALAALSGAPNSQVKVLVRKPTGREQEVTLNRFRPSPVAVDDGGTEPIREVSPGVMYVDGSRADDADVFAAGRDLLTAAGVIFDLRSPYTSLGMTTLGWLTDRDGRASEQFIHTPVHPDRAIVDVRTRETRILANPAKMLGKMVFLTGPATRGETEFAVLTMQDFNLGFVVGEETAGAPAMAAIGVLPGGLEVSWTGIESRSISGEVVYGVGVPPDARVRPTRRALAEGRDEAIEAAIKLLDQFFETLRDEVVPQGDR